MAAYLTVGLSCTLYRPEVSDRYLWGAYHVHSTVSDGLRTVSRIAEAAKAARVDVVILTDHGRPNRDVATMPVRSDMSAEFLDLMGLYPQPVRRQPSVKYLPQRRHYEGARGGGIQTALDASRSSRSPEFHVNPLIQEPNSWARSTRRIAFTRCLDTPFS